MVSLLITPDQIINEMKLRKVHKAYNVVMGIQWKTSQRQMAVTDKLSKTFWRFSR